MKKSAVFSCMGLGDGLITLILSQNLYLNGCDVVTFHPFLQKLQSWFPHLTICPLPPPEELASFDEIFIFYERSEHMLHTLRHCEKYFPEKTKVLNPIATPKRDYPYWEVGKFDGKKCFVENLHNFCQLVLGLPLTTKNNGIIIPETLRAKKFPKRIVIHPTSSRVAKNWSKKKYLWLSKELTRRGFEPVLVLTKEERAEWENQDVLIAPTNSLIDLAGLLYESGYMIGNDSGVGHFASLLGLPTLILCRNQMGADFWRPGWWPGKILYPAPWIPNIKFARLRDKYWQRWISGRRVLTEFLQQVSA